MLSVRHISYRIGKVQILEDISLDFAPGSFNMILGPNGSGKSSFLKIFSGQVPAGSGEVLYGNKPLKMIGKEELAKVRAVMSQQPELNFPLSVDEVVMMGRYPHFDFSPAKKDIAICNEVIARMKLESFRERNYLTLSGGEKQRVQYARVLAQIWEKPEQGSRYLFLDEPLNSLDINYQQEFLKIAKAFAGNETVLVAVMHDINLAIQYADQLVFFNQGKLVASGHPCAVLTSKLLEEIYQVQAQVISNPLTGSPLIIFT